MESTTMTDAAQFVDQGQDTSSQSQSPYIASTTETAKSSPFACNVCKRNYSRVDHLARHYVSITFLIRDMAFASG